MKAADLSSSPEVVVLNAGGEDEVIARD